MRTIRIPVDEFLHRDGTVTATDAVITIGRIENGTAQYSIEYDRYTVPASDHLELLTSLTMQTN